MEYRLGTKAITHILNIKFNSHFMMKHSKAPLMQYELPFKTFTPKGKCFSWWAKCHSDGRGFTVRGCFFVGLSLKVNASHMK